jgi:hypothetical protein
MINITGNFLNRILELFSTADMVFTPSMGGILKLAILSTIDILTILSKQMNKPYHNRSAYVTAGEASFI